MIHLRHAQATRILLVEDDPEALALLKAVLPQEGFVLLPPVSDPGLLLQQLPIYAPNLMIVSVDLATCDAVQLVKEALKRYAVPLLYVAKHTDNALLERLQETAPMGLIFKPLTREKVVSSIGLALYKAYMDGALKAQEALLNSTLSSIPHAVLTVNRNQRIRYANQAAALLLERPATALTGQDLYSVLHLRDRVTQAPVKDLERWLPSHVLADGTHTVLELVGAEGRVLLVEPRVTHTHDFSGTPNGVVVVLHDVQEQFLTQESVRIMAGALESQDDAVVVTRFSVTGVDPRIVYVNKAFEVLTGWQRDAVLGGSLQLLSAQGKEELEATLAVLASGKTYRGEHLFVKKNGARFIAQQVATPVYDQRQRVMHYAFVLRDVTELRHLEARIRSTQRLEAIGRLAGGFAHDFNNLLSIITSYSDLLKIKIEDNTACLRYLGNIQQACVRAETLVSQLMAFSQRDTKAKHWVSLTPLVEESRPILERMLPSELTLVVELAANLPPIWANRSEVEQSLLNLAQNAAEAMSQAPGMLTLRTFLCTQACVPVGLVPQNYVCLQVQDTGPGIDAELQEHLFEPFSSTKDVGQGAGLGLAYVYGVVKQCGGDILVESQTGACFTLYFPCDKKT